MTRTLVGAMDRPPRRRAVSVEQIAQMGQATSIIALRQLGSERARIVPGFVRQVGEAALEFRVPPPAQETGF